MTTSSTPSNEEEAAQPRDEAFWAKQASTFRVTRVPTGALNLNVEGRQALSPLQGFGQMWQKTYRVQLKGVTVQPAEVIKVWKENFPKFWPEGNRFYAPLTGIAPGEVALLNLTMAGGMTLSTGVLVLYADDESFTLMTPQGHMFAGWITFSAYEEDGCTIAQALVLIRANDPIYEIGFRLGGHKKEDKFWEHTLKAVGEHFGVDEVVQTEIVCIDPRFQWSEARNIWHNAAMRTAIYKMAAPLRWIRKRGRTEKKKSSNT